MIETRLREFRRIFSRQPRDAETLKLLEIGCGNGQWLVEFQQFGLLGSNLAGIDVDASRIATAKRRVPNADLRDGDAATLPWDDDSFDVVFQSTVFSSVLDDEKRQRIADEMKRVCNKRGGDSLILWYDFAFDNPRNNQVKGVKRREIAPLFAPWRCDVRRVTLAPPLTRSLISISRTLCELLERSCPFLRTHLVAEIAPPLT